MNKNIKASIAIAAGVVLLMGGAGSLAYWNDAQTLGSAGTISAGTLTATPGTGGWTKSFNGGTASAVTLGSTQIVPGNTLVYTQTFTVNASGSDLYFTVAPTAGSVTGTGGANAALQTALGTPTIAVTTNAAATGTTVAPSTTTGTYKIGAGTTATTFTVTWTIAWPFGTAPASNTTGDNAAKTGSVTLTNGALTLTQVATP